MRERLIQRQVELAVTDGEMANLLGIPRTTWSAVKLGRIGVSLTTARAAVKAFPDLEPLLLGDMTASAQPQKPVAAA